MLARIGRTQTSGKLARLYGEMRRKLRRFEASSYGSAVKNPESSRVGGPFHAACASTMMASWPKDATDFTVSVTRNVASKTSYSYVPKPVLNLRENPRHLTFKIRDGQVLVTAGKK